MRFLHIFDYVTKIKNIFLEKKKCNSYAESLKSHSLYFVAAMCMCFILTKIKPFHLGFVSLLCAYTFLPTLLLQAY